MWARAITLAAIGLSAEAAAQTVLVNDTLRGSTSGARTGGELGPDGWRVTAADNRIIWHIPTVQHGAVEFSVGGLRSREDRVENADKAELFHMYDWTFENADTSVAADGVLLAALLLGRRRRR